MEEKKKITLCVLSTNISDTGSRSYQRISRSLMKLGLLISRFVICPSLDEDAVEFLTSHTDVLVIVAESNDLQQRDKRLIEHLTLQKEKKEGLLFGFIGETALVIQQSSEERDDSLLLSWLTEHHFIGDCLAYSISLISPQTIDVLCRKSGVSGVEWTLCEREEKVDLYLSGGTKEKKHTLYMFLSATLGPFLCEDEKRDAIRGFEDDLIAHHETVSCAESCTCGLCAKLLTDRSGSSSYFVGGAETYAAFAKMKIIGVKKETIDEHTVVSKEVAIEMAEGVRTLLDTDLSISTTGVAGPTGGTEESPVGTVWMGFSSKTLPSQAVCLHFSCGNRDEIRRKAAVAALILASCYRKGLMLLDIVTNWQYI